ncbi:hypothetical protein D3C79_900130 [compost metagenome]
MQLLARHEALLGRASEQVVEIRVWAGHQGVAQAVGDVDVDKRHVQVQGGHGQQHFAVVIRRLDGLKFRVQPCDIGGQAAAGRQKRQTHGRCTQAPLEHAFIHL